MTNLIAIDALDAMPSTYALTVNVRYQNLWRLRLGLTVLRCAAWVAGKIIRTRLDIQIEEPTDALR